MAETGQTPILHTPPSDTTGLLDLAQGDDQQPDDVNWGLTIEDAPLGGSTLSGNKALMDEYLEDELNPKKNNTGKSNSGKGKKGNIKQKNDGEQGTMGAR